jgi:hypothetical protein
VAQGDEATLKRAVIKGLGARKQNFGRLKQAVFSADAYIDRLDVGLIEGIRYPTAIVDLRDPR